MRVVVYSALLAVALLGGIICLLQFSASPGADPTVTDGSEVPEVGTEPETSSPLVSRDPVDPPAEQAASPDSHGEGESIEPGSQPLPEGFSDLQVKVLNPSGKPFADVSVFLERAAGSAGAVTGVEGFVHFGSVGAGLYDLRVEPPLTPGLRAAERIHLQPYESADVTLRVGRFELLVSGRVLMQRGKPIAGVAVKATRFPRNPGRVTLVPVESDSQHSVSDERGFYEVRGLEEGDYILATAPTGDFPPTKRVVRAGAKSFDIVLEEGRELRVTGRVTDLNGRPLEAVRVSLLDDSRMANSTGPEGSYEMSILLGETQRTRVVSYRLEGYRAAQEELRRNDVSAGGELELNVHLVPLGFLVPVSGWVRTSDGLAVEGQAVYLESASLKARLKAESDSTGRFTFPEVEVGEDYSLRVPARKGWRDYVQKPLVVSQTGVELDILLEALPSGSITGQIVDLQGQPVPSLEFSVKNPQALSQTLLVKGDESGWFEVDEVPAGSLIFETRALPRFTVRNVRLEPGTTTSIRLVVDMGPHEIAGTVVDSEGLPLPGARVELSWDQRAEDSSARSLRRTNTDEDGRFTFTGLGGGSHRLRISARGFHPAQCACEVGSEEVLEPISLRALVSSAHPEKQSECILIYSDNGANKKDVGRAKNVGFYSHDQI